MKTRIAMVFSILVLGLIMGTELSQAQTASTLTAEASRMETLAASQGETKVTDKLSAEFSSFLGGYSHSRAVVTGLRNGTPISLTTTTPGSPPLTTPTTITPPTGKMGFGNVFITLALAKYQLSQMGITQPAPSQLQAALVGGPVTTRTGTTATTTNLQGILTMRSQNMGWGQIAQKLGYKLGPIVSGLKAVNQGLAAGTNSPTGSGIVNASGQSAGTSEGGIVTGSGKSVARSGKGASGKSESGEGIVTGSGRPVGSPSPITTGRGHGYGLSGGGPGNSGQAKGHSK